MCDSIFDTSAIWAKVLKALRENNELALHSVCSNLDVEFTNDEVVIAAHNESSYNILTKHIGILKKYAGGPYIKVNMVTKAANRYKTIEHLKEIFGDKLKIENK